MSAFTSDALELLMLLGVLCAALAICGGIALLFGRFTWAGNGDPE